MVKAWLVGKEIQIQYKPHPNEVDSLNHRDRNNT